MKKLVLVVSFAFVACANSEEVKPVIQAPPAPIVFEDITNIVQKVNILWADHTNRINRVEEMRKARRLRRNENGRPPVVPFKAGGKK